MDSFSKKLGKALLYEIKHNSKTLEEIADFANYSVYDLCRIIVGDLFINPKELNMLCYAIGIDTNTFINQVNTNYYNLKGVL